MKHHSSLPGSSTALVKQEEQFYTSLSPNQEPWWQCSYVKALTCPWSVGAKRWRQWVKQHWWAMYFNTGLKLGWWSYSPSLWVEDKYLTRLGTLKLSQNNLILAHSLPLALTQVVLDVPIYFCKCPVLKKTSPEILPGIQVARSSTKKIIKRAN